MGRSLRLHFPDSYIPGECSSRPTQLNSPSALLWGQLIQSRIAPSSSTKEKLQLEKKLRKSHHFWEQRQMGTFTHLPASLVKTLGHHAIWYSGPAGLFHHRFPSDKKNSFQLQVILKLASSFLCINNNSKKI